MCPACVANIALVAAGATSSGGLTAFAISKIFRGKKTNKIRGTEMKLQEIEPETEMSQMNVFGIIQPHSSAK